MFNEILNGILGLTKRDAKLALQLRDYKEREACSVDSKKYL